MEPKINPDRVADLTKTMEDALRVRTEKSGAFVEDAKRVLPAGVASSFQEQSPHPVYVVEGKGSRVTDLDGNEYSDFHNGFGVMVVGHAHPVIASAITEAAHHGTHFAAPNQAAVRVASELVRRFRLPKVRFSNSGTEATLDAIRLGRAFTGKDGLLKIEGSYHGHHDAVMVSVHPDAAKMGPRSHPVSVPQTAGIPKALLDATVVVPFNDPDALDAALTGNNDIGTMIIEPIMMNIGVVPPLPGYLEAVREITAKHGVVLIFDEVKTGATIAAGGVVEAYGVVPDLVALAKATGGGTPIGAILGSEELMAQITDGSVAQFGTFNGNPLTMAAAEATLIQVLNDQAYERLDRAGTRMLEGCQAVCDAYGLPAHAVGVSSKGCVMFAPDPIVDFRSYVAGFDEDLNYLGWLYHMVNDVYMTPGADEQWTLSIAHTDAELDHYIAVFEEFARDVTST
ncbi:MAG: aminotransferase class III-fold pyridoxal phosphate-dependent enzyme [Proteobacteria bacterium]|nr:aminotransferase class III-fold pyridoxal phosphate-dependent enzyme [Pseudomonadota bacterium]